MAITEERKTAHKVFSALVKGLRMDKYTIPEIAELCSVAEQTVRQYLANPDTTAFRTPTIAAIDALIDELARVENMSVKRANFRVVFRAANFPSATFRTAIGAQDYIDHFSWQARPDIEVVGGGELPELTEDQHLRLRWRQVSMSKNVPLYRRVLAEILGISVFEVGLVGRELSLGITPTPEQVEDAEWAKREDVLRRTA
jgi:hypothetical protein